MSGKYRSISLIEAIRKTIHNSEYSADELSDRLGISPNLVYRMALEGESGDGFHRHLQRAVALVNATGKTEIIQALARLCGGYFTREPRQGLSRNARQVQIAEFNLEYALLLKTFALLLAEPTTSLKKEFDRALDEHIAHALELKRQANGNPNQCTLLDLAEEEV